MLKYIFVALGFIGMVIISILAFTIPKDPFLIIPAISIMSFDKPLWLCIILGGGFAYLLTLFGIYDKVVGIEDND